MAAEITDYIFINKRNTIDLLLTLNGGSWPYTTVRVVTELYDTANVGGVPPIIIDSNVAEDQDAYDYSEQGKLILAFGYLTQLQGMGGKSYYAEITVWDAAGKNVLVSSVKSDSSLPTLTLKVKDKPYLTQGP